MSESLFGATLEGLGRVATEAGLPAYGARQLSDWLYGKNATSFNDMLNLPRAVRERLAHLYSIHTPAPVKVTESSDGTRKYLFPASGGGFVEAAWIPEGKRATLCLSVQVGCKMGCLFCMTGKQGFQGHLAPGEILNQYRSLPERDSVTNIVYMGMGEPMDNLQNVLESLEVLCSPYGYGLSPSRVTVSTVGLIPAMEEFLDRSRCHLAVSMHSPFEEERRRLMPVENVYPLKDVLAVLRDRPMGRQRRVSFEYIMFQDVNDSDRHAREVARILNGIRCRVNLIPFHPIPGTPLAPSPRETMERFQLVLKQRGILTTIRQSRGLDISAACGMLSTREMVRQRGEPE
ncbi:MAG TPA: 23S rRNA (adenine(2503)-C(2))-methyltransferase RlmN [Spirochaetia bacterium]|nr:23S rRNA (adenine(2503)-C(2))-methyltransferase RlmN [Spirochaetia bacterium]